MKQIITSGCSFTNCGKSWPYHIKEHDVYNVGSAGAGNGYISRAAIYQCERLLESGTNVEDIFLIVMWSGIDRFEVLSTSDSPLHKDYISGDSDVWWLANYDSSINVNSSVWLKSSVHGQKWQNKAVNHLFDQYWKYFYSVEESFLKTLEYILRVQHYCEVRNIKYKMCCWQNIFNKYEFIVPAGYARENDRISAHELWLMAWLDGQHWRSNRYWPKEITQEISRGTPLLKDEYKIKHNTTYLWDMIDWDKWWFYEDDQVEYGGLSEWVLLGEKHNMGMQHDPHHPSEDSHKEFAEKEVLKWIY